VNPDRFTGQIAFRALFPWEPMQKATKSQLFEITEELGFRSERHGWIIVPKGLITDLASIPPAVHAYLDAKDKTILGPCLPHDYLYERQGVMPWGRNFTRAEADDVLQEACVLCGMRPSQAWMVRRMVGLFGGGRWKSTDIGDAV
jgi:hypothetical protein